MELKYTIYLQRSNLQPTLSVPQVKSVKTITTPEEKLNWIFTAFDEDGGGSIDVSEIREIVLGCFRMAGIDEDEDLLPSCVEDVRASIDVDGDGDISKEEFIKNALKNKFISRLLKYDNSDKPIRTRKPKPKPQQSIEDEDEV